jgi:hypothetical protein
MEVHHHTHTEEKNGHIIYGVSYVIPCRVLRISGRESAGTLYREQREKQYVHSLIKMLSWI